jgi:hypothetical protein
VLKQLDTIAMDCPQWIDDRTTCSALDRVLLISGVSGGSITAAHFALFGKKRLDRQYETQVIEQNAFLRAMSGFIKPNYWFDRTQQFVDILEENYQVQGRIATFNDLNERIPFLIIGSTDVVGEEFFPITQTTFDDLCADLDRLPVAAAVAMAGNFPFVLNGVHLQNYHEVGACSGDDWKQSYLLQTEDLLKLAAQPYYWTAEANLARYRLWMRKVLPQYTVDPTKTRVRIENPKGRSIKFLHLFDGGLSDNLGVRPVARNVINDKTLEYLFRHGVLNIVFVSINAHGDPINPEYQSRSGPNWLPGLLIDSVFSPIEKNSEITQFSLQRYLTAYFAQKEAADKAKSPTVEIIQFDPDLLYGNDAEEVLREDYKNLSMFRPMDDNALEIFKKTAKTVQERAPCISVLKDDMVDRNALMEAGCVIYEPGMKETSSGPFPGLPTTSD